jgi:hypothetical protein
MTDEDLPPIWGPTERLRSWLANGCSQGTGESPEQQALFERDMEEVLGGKDAIEWLFTNMILPTWEESLPIILETLEGTGAPPLVIATVREMMEFS